jgi:hypothetical protein
MSNAESNPLATPEPDASPHEATPEAAVLARLLHDFKNQLGGLKLYVAFLKKSLVNNSLDVQEGIEVCDKLMQQIDALTARAKEAARNAAGNKS